MELKTEKQIKAKVKKLEEIKDLIQQGDIIIVELINKIIDEENAKS